MAKKVGWSLNIETGIEVKQESFNKAAKIFDNFYNKYNDQQVQIDTSDMINTVKNSIAVIKNLYKDGTQDSTSWLNIRPEMKQTFESILSDAENMFSGIKTLFNDGSYVTGLENILKSFDNQLSIVFSDIGAKYDELYAKQKQLAGTLGDVGDFEDDFSQSDIRARIDLLHELIQVQNEMEGMNPSLKPKDFAAGYNTKQLQNITASWKDILSDMESYNLQTVQQLNKRRDILNSVYKDQYDYYDFEDDKEAKNYDTAIARLTEYIQERKELINRLQVNEYELFSVDGIEEYVSHLNGTISIYENYLDEFKQLKGDDNIGGNFSEVVQQLKEIKETILGLKDAFEPLTNAFADGGSAIHKILTTSVDDLNALAAKCSEVYQMIDTISNKQFNMTNVISNGNSTQADLEQIRQFRKEAREVYKQVEELYQESFTTSDKIKGTPEGFSAFLDFSNTMSDFDMTDLAKRIKSRSATSLGVVIDELNEWKKVLLQFNSLRNNVEAGSFNVSKYSDTSSKVKIGSKTTDKDDTTTSDRTAVDSDNIENKVKKLGEEIASDLIAIRTKMEETFDFNTIPFNDEVIKSKIDAIYQQFVELQSKVNALDLNINIPAVVAQIDDNKVKQAASDSATTESADKVDVEAQAMQDVATHATEAATAKDKFAEANKKVAKTAEETSQEVEKEAKKMEEAAGAIVEASQASDKVKVKLDADAIPQSKTVTNSEIREKAIRTTSTDYTYDDGFWVEGATTIVDDFKKRAAELKKEADKIALAQKTVDKFISQFESKTAGQGSTIKGFDALKNFKIENLDDIEKATQAMLDLDNEYNKITKNFRQGTKSMNPFVNAITGIDEMENKIKEAEIAFGALNNKPDELSNEVAALSPLLEKMKSFIAEDANGDKVITDIYGLSKAYGELNVALRQVNSNINIQKKIDTSQYKDASFGLDLEKQLSALTKQQAQWAKSGQLTDELRQKIESMFDSLAEVTNSSELSNWKKQWSILKDEVTETKYQMDAAQKAQAQNNYGKTIYNREERHHEKIGANLRSVDEGTLSPDFLKKINQYEAAYQKLKSLREEIANNPIANDSTMMQNSFQDATLEVEKLRKEILATFKEGQKFESLNILGQQNFDTDQLQDLKSTMIEFAAEVTNGQFKFEGFNDAGTEMYGTLDRGAGSVEKVTVALREGTNTLYAYQSGTKQVSNSWQTLGNDLVNGAKRLVRMYFGFHEAIQAVRKGLTYVKEIDLALTELKKVTDETDETYKKFLGTASDVSSIIGSTVSDFTDATAAFARLGYSLNESAKMAETAIVYKNVADGLDSVEESTDSIISTMMAYGIEANNTMGIIDRFNAVGNNFAITSAGIGEAMQRSASALYAGGNTIDESIALITAANSVIQDPMQVGTALKTLTLRLRGAKTELQEAGLDAEDMVETTSQLQAKLKALTHGKVDIMIDEDTFKNTTQILREMSYAWQDMTDIERAAALELMGGKRQANILSSLITNFDTVENVIATSVNSQGSAMAENEKWLDSIEGKTYQFTNALETMWSNMIDAEVVKDFISFGTEMIQFLDTVPGKITAIVAALAGVAKFKGYNPLTLGSEALQSFKQLGNSQSSLNILKQNFSLDETSAEQSKQYIQAYGMAVSNLTPKLQANMLATNGLTKEQIKYAMQCNDIKDDIIEEATAHVAVKKAKDQSRLSNEELIKSKIKESSINLQLSGDSDKIAAGKWLEAEATKYATTEELKAAIVKDTKLTPAAKAAALAAVEQTGATNNLTMSFKALIKTNPAMVISAIGTFALAAVNGIRELANETSNLKEEYDNLQSSITTTKGEIDSIDSELSNLQDQINSLSNKNLTLAEAEELQKLKAQTAELEKQKELQKSVLEARNQQNQVKSMSMINNLLKTSAANQEKAAESGAKWGKTIGTIAGIITAVAAVALAPFTGGGSLAAGVGLSASLAGAGSAALTAGIFGGQIGSTLGEWAGESLGSALKERGDSLIEWYESYTEAISQAETEAAKAEAEYLSNVSDKNYENWQKKVDAVNTLQTEMYNGLEEMQGYINNLDYTDATKDVIDGYNQLMTHISVTSMDGDVNAQISSIEALKAEYESLSRGVDEHGNNIALSAEEYARYQAIISQVLGYNVGLTQSFDENGSAIRDASGNLVNYNAILTETIKLLQQQQREAAIEAIEGENKDNAPLWKAYESAKEQADNAKKSNWNLMPNAISSWNSDDAAKVIGEIIGEKQGLFDNPDTLIKEYTSKVAEHRDEIIEAIAEGMRAEGVSEEKITSYVDQYTIWLDDAIGRYSDANNVLSNEFKKTLALVPQMSDAYYDLSGSQLAFVNEYISSLKLTDDMSKKQIKQIKDDIISLVDTIGDDKTLQTAINDLIALDPSSMPVAAYRAKFTELWNAISSSIPEGQQETLLNQLFPDQSQIDTMIDAVKQELEVSSRVFVQGLSLEELRIAYKIIPELPDDATFEELKQAIQEHLPKATGPIVETYTSLIEQVNKFNEVELQTSEIVLDNTKVTQEYKDSLVELGVSEEELAECFDANNELVVVNAKQLNKLVKSAKNNTAQNVKLAKSQAKLQYYELYKKMQGYINAEGKVVAGKVKEIVALYEEMNALEKTIAKYSRLEVQLLDAANAYEKFEQAQEIDAATNYIDDAASMVLALGEAFNTAELGSETAQAAIAGLVPKSVYEDLDTVDEKMSAIYDYFKQGKIAQYFTLEYDDDGSISSAEMKLGNLRKFIEDGLYSDNNKDGINVFEGTDWQHFEFSDKFLDGLDEAPDKLQYFADQMGVTKEVAFAFIESINDHDIEWLNGDYGSLFDILTPETLEGSLYNTMQSVTDLNVQLATGKVTAEEYRNSMYGLQGQLNSGTMTQDQYNTKVAELKQQLDEGKITLDKYNETLYGVSGQESILADQAREQANAWYEKNEKLAEYNEQLQEYYKQLETGKDADGNIIDAEKVRDQVEEVTGHINELTGELAEIEEPTQLTLQVALDDIQKDLDKAKKELEAEKIDLEKAIAIDAEGKYYVTTEFAGNQKLENYVSLLNEQHTLEVNMGSETPTVLSTLESVSKTLSDIKLLLETKYNLKVDTDGAVTNTSKFKEMWDSIKDKNITLFASVKKSIIEFITRTPVDEEGGASVNGTANVRGTVHAKGTAHKSGNWGLPNSEHDSLVGELGPEMVVNPHTGRYYTVGDNGAEMVDLPKGAIIFNHKQTEGLLKNGHIASRGKAYAEGNAHVTIWPTGSSQQQWDGTGYSSATDPTYDLSEALDSASDSVEEFEETIDWIETRMEELDEALSLYSAKLENADTLSEKNDIVDQMIAVNEDIYDNAIAGAEYYTKHAEQYLVGMSDELVTAAKNGAIAITDFTQEADEATVEAIENYREFSNKAADLTQQAVETITEIRNLAIQKIDNAEEHGAVRATIEDSQTKKLQNAVDYDEERGMITNPAYYSAMMENSYVKIGHLTTSRNEMQKAFDEAVKNGDLVPWTDPWYEELDKLYQADAEIAEANMELEEFQNSLNDLYWDSFDELMDNFDYLSDETQSLIELMDSKDMFTTPDGAEYWGADDVQWTKEGMATLGLHAQEYERAEAKAKACAKAIDDLNAEYAAGHYSESEYREKLHELTQEQYDAIEAAEKEKEAIVELNKERIDAIKEGIEKEIDAYEELIEKKKEELDAEKDLYDFQKSTQEQQKNIADIQRKLAALSGDNSASAVAKRKQLEAELLEAQADLEDSYYDRSISQQKEALDTEAEDFRKEKESEIEMWDKYMEDVETVVKDSLDIVQSHATEIGSTLTTQANEYNLTVSDAVLSPWQDGVGAIDAYTEKFGDSISSTTAQLDPYLAKWQAVGAAIQAANVEADKYYQANTELSPSVAEINKENQNYISATPQPQQTTSGSGSNSNSKPNTTKTPPSVGSSVTVDTSATHFSSKSGSAKMAPYVPGGKYTVYQTSGSGNNMQVLIGRNGVYTGWVKLTDLKGYATGTTGIDEDQWAWIDEIGEELVLHAGENGKLQYLTKGTAVIPHNLTEKLMDLAMNPQAMLDQNRPTTGLSKGVINNTMEISVDASVGTLLHIEHLDGNNPEEVVKIVNKAWDKKMQGLNNAIRKFSR